MGQIAAVNIANGSGIIHCQRGWVEGRGGVGREGGGDGGEGQNRRVKFDYSAHTMARAA